ERSTLRRAIRLPQIAAPRPGARRVINAIAAGDRLVDDATLRQLSRSLCGAVGHPETVAPADEKELVAADDRVEASVVTELGGNGPRASRRAVGNAKSLDLAEHHAIAERHSHRLVRGRLIDQGGLPRAVGAIEMVPVGEQ